MARQTAEENDWEEDPENDDDSDQNSDEIATVECPYCGEEIIDDAVQCPYCGNYISEEDSPRQGQASWIVWAAILAVVGMIAGILYSMG